MPSKSSGRSRKSNSSRSSGARSSSANARSGSSRSKSGSTRSSRSRSGSSRSATSKSARGSNSSAGSRPSRGASSRRASSSSASSHGSSSRTRTSSARRSKSSARPLMDHDEIRQWAEERNARPACVGGTGGGEDVGMIRLDFPGFSGEQSLEHIEWDEWSQKFDEAALALLVQDTTAGGQQSNFNKMVSRETAESTRKRPSGSTRRRSRRKAA